MPAISDTSDTTVIVWLRKSRSGMIGSSARRSTITNAMSAATPTIGRT